MSQIRLVIIGGQDTGIPLIKLAAEDPSVTVLGVVDSDVGSNGIVTAKSYALPTFSQVGEVRDLSQADMVLDLSEDPSVRRELVADRSGKFEILGRRGAIILREFLEERTDRRRDSERMIAEYEALYKLGLVLSSSDNLQEVNAAIVDYALELTGSPAGSLAIFDEQHGEMYLGAAKGFSPEFSRMKRWKLRSGGLTSYILNQSHPVVVDDLRKHAGFDNPLLVNEGVTSLIAVPLSAEGKLVGILYVDDFEVRQYRPRDVSVLSLLSTFAALSIERTRILEETRILAITDGLTSLFNQRHFSARLEEEVARSGRYRSSLSLAMLDIDHFKNYNDNQGHLKGNDVLRTVATMIKDNVRKSDICARAGGEEFAVIMPLSTANEAVCFGERIRRCIECHEFEGGEGQPLGRLTVSIGVATLPEHGRTSHELVSKADAALYTAKSRGRNSVVLWDSDLSKV